MIKKITSKMIMFLIILLVTLFIINSIGIFNRKAKTYPAKVGVLDVQLTKDIYLFRNEVNVFSNTSGDVEFLVKNGKRVSVGQEIAKIKPKSMPNLEKASSDEYNIIDVNDVDSNLEALNNKLSYSIQENKFSEINELKERIARLNLIKDNLVKNDNKLYFNRAISSETKESNETIITAPISGIASFETSDDDEYFSSNNVSLMVDESLKNIKERKINQEVRKGDNLLRVVDNLSVFAYIPLEKKELEYFKIDDSIDIKLENETISAKVYNIIDLDYKTGIVLNIKEMFTDCYSSRKIGAVIVPSLSRGLIIKESSIVEKDGTVGVYILKIDDTKEFVPIKIKSSINDQSTIYYDSFTVELENGKTESVDTVNLYDEVIEKP